MIYTNSLGRALQYYPGHTAFSSGDERQTFRELHNRVGRVAAALKRHGFKRGDRLALLLPNEPEYIEVVYACAWLGVIVVPLNTRLSEKEIDHVLNDATPHGIVRHSSLAAPTIQVPQQLVIDTEPFELEDDEYPDAVYDPEAVFALIYTSGTTGAP